MSGEPIDAECLIKHLQRGHQMTGQTGEPLPVGNAALVEIDGVECVLISKRVQAFNIDLFTGLGCDLSAKRIVIVKSAQHFFASFSQLSPRMLYVAAPGSATPNHNQLPYRKAKLPKWPITLS